MNVYLLKIWKFRPQMCDFHVPISNIDDLFLQVFEFETENVFGSCRIILEIVRCLVPTEKKMPCCTASGKCFLTMLMASSHMIPRKPSDEQVKFWFPSFFGSRDFTWTFATSSTWTEFALSPAGFCTPRNYYAEEFFRHGLHGPLNWYRTRELNYLDEFEHFFHSGKIKDRPRIEQKVLFVFAKRDKAPPKSILMQRMEERVTNLTKKEVDGGHWMMWEKAEDLNVVLKEWVEGVVFIKELSRLLLQQCYLTESKRVIRQFI